MSGHSKFANIKHRKEKNDAQKGKIFTKLGREIMVAVKQGGADPENNTRLKEIINKAKSNNMPNDTISRSIKKASGEAGDVNYENITYEGYGPGGVAVMVVCGTTGCVSFMFEKKGQIVIEKSDDIDEDELMMAAIEAGAEDMNTEEEGYEILIEPDMFNEVNDTLSDLGYKFLSAEVTMMPSTMTELGGDEDTKAIEKMLDQLEEDDDVQDVYTNWDR
ncbi:MAG: YebC/PmpR family DNA-binding transcriptional regulator [Firmicutes bacterium HGW-Firmicutes-5]|nr:MAG: YebC/PmpR family DNA-binding transcriptional regulator [Firmicutes bacterium HGW-Firmicutes-5]